MKTLVAAALTIALASAPAVPVAAQAPSPAPIPVWVAPTGILTQAADDPTHAIEQEVRIRGYVACRPSPSRTTAWIFSAVNFGTRTLSFNWAPVMGGNPRPIEAQDVIHSTVAPQQSASARYLSTFPCPSAGTPGPAPRFSLVLDHVRAAGESADLIGSMIDDVNHIMTSRSFDGVLSTFTLDAHATGKLAVSVATPAQRTDEPVLARLTGTRVAAPPRAAPSTTTVARSTLPADQRVLGPEMQQLLWGSDAWTWKGRMASFDDDRPPVDLRVYAACRSLGPGKAFRWRFVVINLAGRPLDVAWVPERTDLKYPIGAGDGVHNRLKPGDAGPEDYDMNLGCPGMRGGAGDGVTFGVVLDTLRTEGEGGYLVSGGYDRYEHAQREAYLAALEDLDRKIRSEPVYNYEPTYVPPFVDEPCCGP